MKTIVLNNRYSVGKGTPEEIKKFNDFYDLEEARLNAETQMQIDWDIEEFMRANF